MFRSIVQSQAARTIRQSYKCNNIYRPRSRQFAAESKSQDQDTSSDQPQQPPPEPESQSAELTEVEKLTQQLKDKQTELAELNDKTLRMLAEMENVRMIARRDVENAKKYAITPFATAMLTVADNLGMALKAVPKSEVTSSDANPQLKGLFGGVDATQSELLKVFSQHGITPFGAVGDTFDPNRYQAVFEAPSAEHQPGTVIDVSKLGYTIGVRILRPAEVGVSKS